MLTTEVFFPFMEEKNISCPLLLWSVKINAGNQFSSRMKILEYSHPSPISISCATLPSALPETRPDLGIKVILAPQCPASGFCPPQEKISATQSHAIPPEPVSDPPASRVAALPRFFIVGHILQSRQSPFLLLSAESQLSRLLLISDRQSEQVSDLPVS